MWLKRKLPLLPWSSCSLLRSCWQHPFTGILGTFPSFLCIGYIFFVQHLRKLSLQKKDGLILVPGNPELSASLTDLSAPNVTISQWFIPWQNFNTSSVSHAQCSGVSEENFCLSDPTLCSLWRKHSSASPADVHWMHRAAPGARNFLCCTTDCSSFQQENALDICPGCVWGKKK